MDTEHCELTRRHCCYGSEWGVASLHPQRGGQMVGHVELHPMCRKYLLANKRLDMEIPPQDHHFLGAWEYNGT